MVGKFLFLYEKHDSEHSYLTNLKLKLNNNDVFNFELLVSVRLGAAWVNCETGGGSENLEAIY